MRPTGCVGGSRRTPPRSTRSAPLLEPVEDELWSEADEVADRPGRWAPTGASWGIRALDAMRTAL